MRVAIIMGSTSDLGKMDPAVSILKEYGVTVDVRCLSAHRAHKGLSEFIAETEAQVNNLHIVAYLCEHNVACIYIDIRNAFGVQDFQSVEQLQQNPPHIMFFHKETSVILQSLLNSTALYILHKNVQLITVLTNGVVTDNVTVVYALSSC